MPVSSTGDPNISKLLAEGITLYRASRSLFWRIIAIIIALAAITGAIFQGLSYFSS